MARHPVRLMRVGRADLPDATAFDAYVGPEGEVTVDHIRGIIALHDGSTPGGLQFRLDAGPQPTAFQPAVRLSLDSVSAVTASDFAGQTSIYCHPNGGNVVPIYNGSEFVPRALSAISLALDSNSAHGGYHQSGKIFDVFAVWSAGAVKIGTGPAWTTDTTRGIGAGTTELESVLGFPVNKQTLTLRIGSGSGDTISVLARQALYLGSFRATANGQASDTKAKRLLFNAYNRTPRLLQRIEPANTWSYSTNAFRQVNGNADNQVDFLLGLAGVFVSAKHMAIASSAAAALVAVSIGLDGTTVPTDVIDDWWQLASTGGYESGTAHYSGMPGLGYHRLVMLERGGGSSTQTWLGQNAGTSVWHPGIIGELII